MTYKSNNFNLCLWKGIFFRDVSIKYISNDVHICIFIISPKHVCFATFTNKTTYSLKFSIKPGIIIYLIKIFETKRQAIKHTQIPIIIYQNRQFIPILWHCSDIRTWTASESYEFVTTQQQQWWQTLDSFMQSQRKRRNRDKEMNS